MNKGLRKGRDECLASPDVDLYLFLPCILREEPPRGALLFIPSFFLFSASEVQHQVLQHRKAASHRGMNIFSVKIRDDSKHFRYGVRRVTLL